MSFSGSRPQQNLPWLSQQRPRRAPPSARSRTSGSTSASSLHNKTDIERGRRTACPGIPRGARRIPSPWSLLLNPGRRRRPCRRPGSLLVQRGGSPARRPRRRRSRIRSAPAHAIEQVRRVDGAGRLKFDFHTASCVSSPIRCPSPCGMKVAPRSAASISSTSPARTPPLVRCSRIVRSARRCMSGHATCVEINRCVGCTRAGPVERQGTDTATPSSRRRVDGERAV